MNDRVQVAIVGGGPAGLAAAGVLARAGAQVVLYDEHIALGGQLRYRLGEIRTEHGVAPFPPRLAAELADSARAAGAEIRPGHRVWGAFAGRELGVDHAGTASVARADRILFATGSVDRSLVFPGGSLPGVFTGRAVQILLNVHYVRPGRRFVLIAEGAEAQELGRAVDAAGGEVVAVLPPSVSDLRAEGADGITGVEADGIVAEADVVVIAAGRIADAGLAFMAECAAGYAADFGGFVPRVDERMAGSVDGIYLAGDCIGPTTPDVALAEGAYAGTAIAASLGLASDAEAERARDTYRALAPGRIEALSAVAGSFIQVDRVPLGSVES